MMVCVACIQMNSGNDPVQNIERASVLIRQAAHAGAAFIFTPECVGLMSAGHEDLMNKACVEEDSKALKAFQVLCQELSIWLVVGSLAIKPSADATKTYNRSYLLTPQGAIAARYDKLHLYDVALADGLRYQESRSYVSGDNAVLAETPFGKIGMTICYDVRFPYLYRHLAQAGAEIMSIPAAFVRHTGEAHWDVLLRARAIENGCFVVAPAQTGEHPAGRLTYGHSMIINPWGEVLADAGVEEGYCMAELDISLVEKTRHRIPSLTHCKKIDSVAYEKKI